MQQPMIVTGLAVPYDGVNNNNTNNNNNFKDSYVPPPAMNPNANISVNNATFKGEAQPKAFQDMFFGILFYAHLIVILVMMGIYGNTNSYNGGNSKLIAAVGTVASVSSVFAAVLGSATLGFMMKFAKELVKMSLIFSVCMSLTVGVLGLMWGQILTAIMGFLSFAIGICYAYFVWDRIPFAAANLNTAITAVKVNKGLLAAAGLFLILGMLWSICWSVTTAGATAQLGEGTLFWFFLSFYWTHQVIQNVLHVTTAGVVGTWWFSPIECSSCCSSVVTSSFIRATTFSFGSICFGSLLVAIVQALRQLNYMTRDQEDCQILNCIIDCILGCVQSIIEYLNKWAYVYVGLYGYSYLEAGKNVITLFEHRGWTTIITDDLVDNALLMVSFGIGLATGLVGLLFAYIDKYSFQALGYSNVGAVGFIIGFLAGFVISSILMSVIGSATNTVIVCYAESPNEFQQNHPVLSSEMRLAWRQAWPEEFTY